MGLLIHAQDTIDEKGKGHNKLSLILMALCQDYMDTQSIGSDSAASQSSSHLAASKVDGSTDPERPIQELETEKPQV